MGGGSERQLVKRSGMAVEVKAGTVKGVKDVGIREIGERRRDGGRVTNTVG